MEIRQLALGARIYGNIRGQQGSHFIHYVFRAKREDRNDDCLLVLVNRGRPRTVHVGDLK